MRGPSGWMDHASSPLASSTPALRPGPPPGQTTAAAWYAAGLGGWLTGRDGEHFWVDPAIMLGQDLAENAGRGGDGPAADLAARDRQMGNGHREAGP
jgi:hypothetical protein